LELINIKSEIKIIDWITEIACGPLDMLDGATYSDGSSSVDSNQNLESCKFYQIVQHPEMD